MTATLTTNVFAGFTAKCHTNQGWDHYFLPG